MADQGGSNGMFDFEWIEEEFAEFYLILIVSIINCAIDYYIRVLYKCNCILILIVLFIMYPEVLGMYLFSKQQLRNSV